MTCPVSAKPPVCAVCGTGPTVQVDLYNGHRCETHAPAFDPNVAVRILMNGWPGLAAAYCRFWGWAA